MNKPYNILCCHPTNCQRMTFFIKKMTIQFKINKIPTFCQSRSISPSPAKAQIKAQQNLQQKNQHTQQAHVTSPASSALSSSQ